MESTDTKEVILEGFLADKYGRSWRIKADTYADIFACIDANYPTFKKDLIDIYTSGGDVSVQVGGHFVEEPEELLHPLTKDTIIITPIPSGSKSPEAKIIIGAILVVVAYVYLGPLAGAEVATFWSTAAGITQAVVTGIGISLVSMGIQQLLAPDPSVDEDEENYLFNGPENTTVSGNPIPILCGEMMIGGIVISAGSIGGTWAVEASVVQTPSDGSTVDPEARAGGAAIIFDSWSPPKTEFVADAQDNIDGLKNEIRMGG